MKYFETEYFIRQDSNELGQSVLLAKQRAGQRGGLWLMELLDNQMNRLSFSNEWRGDLQKVMSEWLLVEDLASHEYASAPNEDLSDPVYYAQVYMHPAHKCFALIQQTSEEYILRSIYMPYLLSDKGVFASLVEEGYFTHVPTPSYQDTPKFGMMVKTPYGYSIRYVDVRNPAIDLEGYYGSDFKEISDKMVESTSNPDLTGLIILHGIPGTGKTSYLRWLSGQAKRRFVYIPTEIVGQLSSTEFASFLMENTGLTYIVEDAETILMSREDGHTNSHVASILNMTDGIQGDIFNSQFICTFNTSIENIDPALLRPGRLIVDHEFKALEVDDANALLTKLGKTADATEPMTLAKIMN